MKPGYQSIIRRLACLLALPLLLVATAAPATAAIRYAAPGGTQAGACADWGSACDLQYALAVATSGDEIWVKSGLYKPTGGTNRSLSFALKDGVAIYGGFDGSETAKGERPASGNVTTLSGAIVGGSSYHVVTAGSVSASAILDRFTITGGSADGYGAAGDGGGIRIDGGTPTLTNLLVTGNSARYNGGGIAIFGGAPLITNVTVSTNQAGLAGGGLYSFNAAPEISNATVTGNQAGIEGGGLAAQAGSPLLTNVTLSNNSAELEGDGLAALDSALAFRDSIVWGGVNGVIADYLVPAVISRSIVQGGCPTGASCSAIQSADPLLGGLGSHGGPTSTIPLLAGSPAVNALGSCLTATDQRGVSRPQGSGCELGAYEVLAPHTVAFNANGGNGTMSPQTADHPVGLTTNGFIRSNHHFAGWNTQTNGSGSAYADGVIYDFAADMALYAQWLAIPSATAATFLTFTGFTANWDAVSGTSGYRLDVASDSGFTNYINGYQSKDVGSSTSLAIGGLAPGGYHYRVRAYVDSVTTDSSNIIDVAILSQHIVTASAGAGGSISPSGDTGVEPGDFAIFTVTPDTNYLIADVSGCGGSLAGSTYNTAPVMDDCAVTATFTKMIDLSMLGDGAVANDAVLNISGTAAPGLSVTINGDPVAMGADGSFNEVMLLGEGGNPVDVVATGAGGASSTFNRTITFDPAAPELSVSTPADNSVTNLEHISVSGTVPAGATLVELTVNDGAPQVLPIDNGTFSGTAYLAEGLNTLALAVTMPDSKMSHVKRTVVRVAPPKPSVAITSPGQDTLVEVGNVTIEGAVADVLPERTVTLSLEVDGTTYHPALAGGAFSQAVTLAGDGLYPVIVTAADDLGNESSVRRNLVGVCNTADDVDCDGKANAVDNCPTVANFNQLDSDGDGLGDACDACPLDGDNDVDSDGVCGNVDNCPLTINADQLDTDGDGEGDACDADIDGDGIPNEVEIATGTDPLNPDTTPPTLTVSTLNDGAYTNNPDLNVSGTATDAGGLDTVTVNGEETPVIDGIFSSLVTLVSGGNSITVTARDVAGNQTTNVRTINLDQAVPQITLTAPADNSATAQNSVLVSGSINETATLTVKDHAGSTYVPSSSGNSFNQTVPLQRGLNTLTVTAEDLAGNVGSAVRTVMQDSLSPSLTVNTPPADTTVRNGVITIAGEVSDIWTDVAVTIEAGEDVYTPAVNAEGQFSQQINLPSEGLYPILVTAADAVGNTTTVQRNILHTLGIVTINAGAEYSNNRKVSVTISYYPNFVQCRLSSDNLKWGKWVTIPAAATHTATFRLPKVNGTQTVYAQFRDGSGTESDVYTDTIILDVTRPSGTITINDDATLSNDPVLTITSNVTGATEMQFSADKVNWSGWQPYAANTTFTLPIANQADGKKIIFAKFRDAAGNLSKTLNSRILFFQ